MSVLRHILLRRRGLAVWLLAVALATRMLVPSGYMIGNSAGSITIELCSGYGAQAMPMPGTMHHPGKDGDHKTGVPCAYAGLSTPSLAAADPVPFTVVAAFVAPAASQMPAAAALPGPPSYLRPPLRGPPPLA